MTNLSKAVISVPSQDLREADVTSSVMNLEELMAMPLPPPLRTAVELLAPRYGDLVCLPRPEIFTHGVARDWLDGRLGPDRQHVCLSDGMAVKLIDGLENHVFFYDLSNRVHQSALENLIEWAPESFGNLRSQINSFHGVRLNGRLVQPPTTMLLPTEPFSVEPPTFYEFFLDRHSATRSAEMILDTGAIAPPALQSFSAVTYVALNDSAAEDEDFARLAAKSIATAYFDSGQCVIIRLPRQRSGSSDISPEIIVAMEALQSSEVVLPRVPASNVFLIGEDLPESFFHGCLEQTSLIADETFDFWRYTARFYGQLKSVQMVFRGDRRRMPQVIGGMTEVIGRAPHGPASLPAFPPFVLSWRRGKPDRSAKT